MHLLCVQINTYIKIVTIFHFRQKKSPENSGVLFTVEGILPF